jgi:hypothetical protein
MDGFNAWWSMEGFNVWWPLEGFNAWWPLKGFNVWCPMEGKEKTFFHFFPLSPDKFYLNLHFSH